MNMKSVLLALCGLLALVSASASPAGVEDALAAMRTLRESGLGIAELQASSDAAVEEAKQQLASAQAEMEAQYAMSPAESPEDAAITSLLQTGTGVEVGEALGACKTCVYVLERIKQGYQYLLPSICVEIYTKTETKDDYTLCHQVLAALSIWGHNVRHWFHYGCYKAEEYGAMELVRPCPAHVMCSQMTDMEEKTFCDAPKVDALADGKKAT